MDLGHLINKTSIELKKAGIQTAQIDARLLLQHALLQDDVYLLTHDTDLITNSQYQKFRRLIRRRKCGVPVAYLTGHKEFYGLNFKVNKNVLIPRPETEVLVENALEFMKKADKNKRPLEIIDLGTGSGCIIISIVKNLLPFTILFSPAFYASDISAQALAIAKQNAKLNAIYNNIQFFKSDLFSNSKIPKQFDLIIANLPYLPPAANSSWFNQPERTGLKFEPQSALFADDQGFDLIQKLILQLPIRLNTSGICLLEVDESHDKKLVKLCSILNLKLNVIQNPTGHKGFFKITKYQR